jgi:aminoglycoside 6'-N-acetyltransferase I
MAQKINEEIIICPLHKDDEIHKKELKELLIESFPHSYLDSAEEEVSGYFEDDKISIMAVIDDKLIGFIGAIMQYGNTGYELHPLLVNKNYQFNGIGTKLIRELEKEVIKRGGITIYLGTDDEFNKTSLSNTDLYEDLYSKIINIKNYNQHPFEFYQKMGYQIVGVIPDANGLGKPDIMMAKRLINPVSNKS